MTCFLLEKAKEQFFLEHVLIDKKACKGTTIFRITQIF